MAGDNERYFAALRTHWKRHHAFPANPAYKPSRPKGSVEAPGGVIGSFRRQHRR